MCLGAWISEENNDPRIINYLAFWKPKFFPPLCRESKDIALVLYNLRTSSHARRDIFILGPTMTVKQAISKITELYFFSYVLSAKGNWGRPAFHLGTTAQYLLINSKKWKTTLLDELIVSTLSYHLGTDMMFFKDNS